MGFLADNSPGLIRWQMTANKPDDLITKIDCESITEYLQVIYCLTTFL